MTAVGPIVISRRAKQQMLDPDRQLRRSLEFGEALNDSAAGIKAGEMTDEPNSACRIWPLRIDSHLQSLVGLGGTGPQRRDLTDHLPHFRDQFIKDHVAHSP